MKPIPFSRFISAALGLLSTTSLAAAGDPHAAWQHVQSVEVSAPGLERFEVPTGTIHVSAPRLEDLRLVSPAGIETPYVIEWPQLEAVQARPVAAFRSALQDRGTVLEMDTGTDKAIHAVTLETTAASFIKAATVEGSSDGIQWQPLAHDEVLFRQTNGASRLRVPFTAGTWKHVRVTISDDRSEAVAFTSASIELEQPATKAIALALDFQSRTDGGQPRGHTSLTVPLGAANLWLAALRIQTPEPVFSRNVKVLASDRVIASKKLFRVALDGHEASALDIPIDAQVRSSVLVLDIENGDSPPMQIGGIEARRYPVAVAFHAEAAGLWQLYSGNSAAQAPSYDVVALSDKLRSASAGSPKVSPLAPNPSFDENATLPETGGPGAAIDLKDWACRKVVTTRARGLLEVYLDFEICAHVATGFADVRVVQAGHQLPYLLQQTSRTDEWKVPVAAVPDAKRPSVSRWQLKLPFAGLPVTTLSANSSTPLFTRQFSLLESRRDSYGNPSWTVMGSASWTRTPGMVPPLIMAVGSRPQGDTLILETDNGDNGALELAAVALSRPVFQLLFMTRDTRPVYIYYGNPQAQPPRYDLSLVEAEIHAVTPTHVHLENEEVLKPVRTAVEDSGKGSPWLWAMLALVVGGLLWLVAKLLPKQEV